MCAYRNLVGDTVESYAVFAEAKDIDFLSEAGVKVFSVSVPVRRLSAVSVVVAGRSVIVSPVDLRITPAPCQRTAYNSNVCMRWFRCD